MAVKHFASQNEIMEAMLSGTPIKSLCGVSSVDAEYAISSASTDCPDCVGILEGLAFY